jgi:hypothetical protein
MIICNLRHFQQHTDFTLDRAFFLHALVSNRQIDIFSIIIDFIYTIFRINKLSLDYGGVICNVLKYFKVLHRSLREFVHLKGSCYVLTLVMIFFLLLV